MYCLPPPALPGSRVHGLLTAHLIWKAPAFRPGKEAESEPCVIGHTTSEFLMREPNPLPASFALNNETGKLQR